MNKLREQWKKHLHNKKGTTLVETMVCLLLISILMAMAAGALSSAFRIFLRIQKTQYAQSILDTTMTELRTLTQDATAYVKIYDSGKTIAGQQGSDSGNAVEFMNKEGYVVLLTTDGCDRTDLYITGQLTGTADKVDSGELLTRYYFRRVERQPLIRTAKGRHRFPVQLRRHLEKASIWETIWRSPIPFRTV